jgi:DNA mismatch repair ATPase MutL
VSRLNFIVTGSRNGAPEAFTDNRSTLEFQGLTLKYHTSKISDFSDLQTLSSFGFRGEALSSLCALADVSVTTRTKEEAVGARLMYDHSGAVLSQNRVARAVGTTVAVSKLFSPLPVRYKEFNRNIRREYGRLLSILQVNCCSANSSLGSDSFGNCTWIAHGHMAAPT